MPKTIPALQRYTVRFSEQVFYTIDVIAGSADDAVADAEDIYDRFGPLPAKGFAVDSSAGGTDDWDATLSPFTKPLSTKESQ